MFQRASLMLALAFLMSGCGLTIASGRPTIQYWAAVDNVDAYQQSAATCSANAAGQYEIQVHPVPSSYTDGYQLISRELAARATDIDLYTMDSTWLAQFADSGWLLRWSDEQSERIRTANAPVAVANSSLSGQIYAAPLTAQTQAIAHDPHIQAPTNWDDEFRVEANDKASFVSLVTGLVANADGKLLGQSSKDADALNEAAETVKLHATQTRNNSAALVSPRDYLRSAATSNSDVAWSKAPGAIGVQQVNIGVVPFSQHKAFAMQAAKCMSSQEQQKANLRYAMFPTDLSAFDDLSAQGQFRSLLTIEKEQLQSGVASPQAKNFAGALLALERAFVPFDQIKTDGFGVVTQKNLNEAISRKVN